MWRIIEAGAGGLSGLFGGGLLGTARPRTQTLQAGSIEECMDWTACIREAITSCTL